MNNIIAILALLNKHIIVANGMVINNVTYARATECFMFWYGDNDDNIVIHYNNMKHADWDAEDNSLDYTRFFTIVDVRNQHHLFKFYRNDSVEIMRQVKVLL